MGTNRGTANPTVGLFVRKAKFPPTVVKIAWRFPMFSAQFRAMTFSEIAAALPKSAVTSIDGLAFPRIASGKVREIFDLGDALLLVASDRLSAFDIILPDGIPGKGAILTQMSHWWFAQTAGLIPNHLLPDQTGEFARRGLTSRDLQLRSMIVR